MSKTEKDKSTNLIVVPWYSSNEWKCVYDLIYNKESNDEQKKRALNVIHIWKDRVNLLCSGVEGTMIILEALFLNNVDDNTLQTVYSSAIMRFINVCINVKDRKCTMHGLAKKYDIPTWVVKIRHEFAHDQKLPPLFICKKALYFALEWLKNFYWNHEYDNIKEHVTEHESIKTTEHSVKLLKLFCNLTLASIEHNANILREVPKELVKNVACSIGAELEKGWKDNTISNIKDELLVRLDKYFTTENSEEITSILLKYLLKSSNLKSDFTEAIDYWETVVLRLLDNKLFPALLYTLYKKIINKSNPKSIRQFCASWIRELLMLVKANNTSEEVADELKQFLNMVLKYPNCYSKEFLIPLLNAANISQDSANKINAVFHIYTSGMDIDNEINEEYLMEVEDKDDFNSTSLDCSNWTLITDNRFHSVPLGVLPGARYCCNPLLDDYLLQN